MALLGNEIVYMIRTYNGYLSIFESVTKTQDIANLASPTAGVASFNTRTGAVVLTTADIAALDLSTLPKSDPGGGKLWINGGGGSSGALFVGTV